MKPDVSDNSTSQTGSFTSTTGTTIASNTQMIGGISVSIGGDYETGYGTNGSNGETLLYGKTFEYLLKAIGGSSELSESFEVPDESGSDISLNYTLDASQNALGTIYQSEDYLGHPLTYEDNYIVITVPDTPTYTFSDGSSEPIQYQIFEKYKLIATIPQVKVDNSGNEIILSQYWFNGTATSIKEKREEGIWINVIAADPPNDRYSAVGPTKYVKTLPKPVSPTPQPVTNITATGGLNQITISWDYEYGTTDAAVPSTYNYIDSIEIYAIINTAGTLDSGVYHYDNADDAAYNFGSGPDASNNISPTVYQTIATNISSDTTSYTTTPRTLWDNEIVGYRIVTKNFDGVYSGQDPNDPTSGNITWGTIQDAGDGISYTYNGTFANTHKQAKTLEPAPATGVTIGGSVDNNQINSSWNPTGTYSNDSPLAYSVSYVYNSTLGAGNLSPSNATLVSAPAVDALENAVSTLTSNTITDLVPGSQYTVTVSVYTNMEDTHADDNDWTVSVEGSKDNTYITTENTISTSNYDLEAVDTNYNVASGFDNPVKIGHSVYQQDFAGNNLTWEHQQYNAIQWQLAGNVTTVPAHMVSVWRRGASAVALGTKMGLDPTKTNSVIASYTMTDNDVIAVFDVTNNWCLDSYVWNDADDAVNKSLLCDNEKIGTGGFMFQLWKSTEKTIHNLYVTSYDKDGTPGSGGYVSPATANLSVIPGGYEDALYVNLKFAIADNKYNIYYKGKRTNDSPVTTTLTYNTTALSDTNKNNYDVTWYSDCTGVTSRSYVGAWISSSESSKWIVPPAQLVEIPHVITILNPIKSSVQYDSNNDPSSDLVLGNSGSQSFAFNSGEWNWISFYVVNTELTTVRNLFETISGMTANDSILLYNYLGYSFKYNYLEPAGREVGWTSYADEPINYDSGYSIKIVTDDGLPRNFTINGKQIQGINQQLIQGWSNMGHPYSIQKTGAIVTGNTNDNGDSLYDKLAIIWDPNSNALKGPYYPVFYDPATSLPRSIPLNTAHDPVGYKYGSSADGGTMGTMNFDPGSYYKIRMFSELILLIGSLEALRNKGDFDGDNNIDINDAYTLANYLVQINPDYASVATAINNESLNKNNHDWHNLKSTAATEHPPNDPDLRDLVYLISHIDQVSGYINL